MKYIYSLFLGLISLFAIQTANAQTYNFPTSGTLNITDCAGTLYDSGGPMAGYSADESGTVVIDPPGDDLVVITFSFFDVEDSGVGCFDGLFIYDGADTGAPQFSSPDPIAGWCFDPADGTGTGDLTGMTFVSSGDALTLFFSSDGSVQPEGWEITFSCQSVEVPPIPEIGVNPQNTCSGDVEIFNDGLIADAWMMTYTWDLGDGTTSTDSIVNHTYTAEGTYDISLEVCNQFGCTDTVFVGAVVFDSEDLSCFEFPMPAFANETITSCAGIIYDNGGPDAPGIQGNNASYTIAPGGSNLIEIEIVDISSLSQFGDVITIYDGPDLTAPVIAIFDNPTLPSNPIVLSSGNSVTVGWVENAFTQSPNFEINFQCIEVVDPPTAAIFASPPFFSCGTDAIAFQDISGNAPLSWAWDFGDGTTSTDENPVHTFADPGMYDVELIACNENGCDTTVFTYDVLIETDPNCEGVSMIANSNIGITECSGILYDSGGSDGNYADNESSTVVLGSPGANSVTLVFTQFNTSFDDFVNVYDGENNLAPLIGSFTGTNLPNFDGIVSGGQFLTVEFITTAFTNNTGFEAYWLVEGGTEPPVAAFSVSDLNPPYNVPIQITDETTEVPTSWFWDFGDGENDFVQNPEHAFEQAGENAIVLTASNCLGTDISDTTIVTVQGQPFMIVDEDPISVTIPAETSLDTTFSIQNFGGGDLVYQVDGFNTTFAGLVQVLAYEFENATPSTQNIFDNIENFITGISNGITYTSTSTTSISELETLLENINIFLVPGQEGGVDSGVMSGFADLLEEFVDNGGVVMFMGTTNIATINNTGLLEINNATDISSSPLSYSVDHPLVDNVDKPFIGQTATISADIANGDLIPIIENGTEDVVAYREQGEGKVLYIGFNYTFANESMNQILENAILWSGTAENAVQWLFADPFEGQIIPGNGNEITLTFNAIGAPGGTFTTNLIITSNDPDNAEVIIPITLTIVGTPGFAVDLTELDFENVIQFTTETLEIVISNPGSDSLFVTDIIMPNSDFSASITDFGLFPGLTQTVGINFSPETVIVYEDLVMTIVTNIGSFDVLLSGNATGAPIVGATPLPLEITLNVDESGSVPLTISNTGLGFLEYCLESTIEGGNTGFEFSFFLDTFNNEFFWQLVDSEGNIVAEVVAGDGTYPTGNTQYTEIIGGLSPTESYTLLIQDTFGDGALDDYTISDLTTGDVIVQGTFDTGDFVEEVLGTPTQNPLDQWMTFDVLCDTLDFPGETLVTVDFDATGFLGGVYETTILVTSNDPMNSVYEIPVIMTVVGIPELEVVNGPADDAYDFGSILIGLSSSNTLTITNPGTDNLIVSDFDFSDDQFSIDATDLNLAPGDTVVLTITFTPDAIAENNATLTLVNNDMDITFDLTASGQGAPAATVNPSEITVTLLSGETIDEEVTIFNTGAGNLDYDITTIGNPITDEAGFIFEFTTDNFPGELIWSLLDSDGNEVAGMPQETYTVAQTLFTEIVDGLNSAETYTLLIEDSFTGCDGAVSAYAIYNLSTGVLIEEGGQVGAGDCQYFTEIGNPIVPPTVDLSLTNGNIGFPDDQSFTVTIDADGTLAGVYEYVISVASNDPTNPVINIPITVNVIAFPQALFSANNDPVVCGDDLIAFSDNSVNVPTDWLWDFGDGTTSMDQNPTHIYTQTGDYTVSLIASNDVGADTLVFEDFITVDIDCQVVSISAGQTTITACNGELYDSGGEGDNYALNSEGVVVLAPAGAVSVTISFTDFQYEDGIDFVRVYDGPDINSPLIVEGTGMELAGTVWTSTGPEMTIEEDSDAFFSVPGFKAFFQCEAVQAAPVAIANSELLGSCSGEVQFNDDSENFPSERLWDFGDGNTSNLKDPSHQYTESGTYTVTLTATNDFGTDMTTITVDVFILSIDASIPTEGFSGNVTSFSINNFQPSWTAAWIFGDNTSDNVPAPTHIYQVEDTTTYTVVLTVSDASQGADCVETIEQEITIYPGAPLPKAELTLQVDTRFSSVDAEGMHVMGDFNNWTPAAMTEVNDSIYSITLEVNADQTHLYRFVNGSDVANSESVPGECGTPDEMGVSSRSVAVGADAMVVDAICFDFCKVCITTGIEEITNANLIIAPNPSNGFLNYSLDLQTVTDLELVIVNALGKTVYQRTLNDQSTYQEKLDLTNLVNGVYWIRFTTADKQLTQPFVLQR